MISQTIARRYARALLALGREDGRFEEYGRELAAFAEVAAHKELAEALTKPVYPAASRRAVLDTLLGKMNLSQTMQNFLRLLLDKGRLGQLEGICAHYLQLVDEVNNVRRAKVTTAGPLAAEAQERVKAALEKMTGRTVILETEEDPGIIGGIVARVGDLTLDGSVKTQLRNLKESLIEG